MTVELACAVRDPQRLERIALPAGASVRDALEAGGIDAAGLPADGEGPLVGIFSRRVALDRALADGDRVEVYAPLVKDGGPRDRQGR